MAEAKKKLSGRAAVHRVKDEEFIAAHDDCWQGEHPGLGLKTELRSTEEKARRELEALIAAKDAS